MILDTLNKEVIDALKAKEEIKLSTLRMLLSALNYEKIAKQHELSDQEELEVVKREVKKRKDAITIYTDKNILDRAEQEKKELAILEPFLPAQASREEIEKVADEVLKNNPSGAEVNMGQTIGAIRSKLPTADGGLIAEVVKSKLQK